MKIKSLIAGLSCTVLLAAQSNALPIDDGKSIFTTRCMACHKIDKDFAGPALANVDQRRSMDWIIKFVQSSQSLIKRGDTTAAALFTKFNGLVMPDHPDLSTEQITGVIEYITAESKKVVAETDIPFEKPYELQPNYSPPGRQDTAFMVSYLIVVGTLILVLLFAVHVKQLERKMHG